MSNMVAVVLSCVFITFIPQERAAAPSLAGRWQGSVTADIGEMRVALAIEVAKEVASGSLDTAHGTFRIANGTFKDGKWTLPFESPDGAKGRMIGVVTADGFSGEWDFRPMARGTFSLGRVK